MTKKQTKKQTAEHKSNCPSADAIEIFIKKIKSVRDTTRGAMFEEQSRAWKFASIAAIGILLDSFIFETSGLLGFFYYVLIGVLLFAGIKSLANRQRNYGIYIGLAIADDRMDTAIQEVASKIMPGTFEVIKATIKSQLDQILGDESKKK